MKTLALLLVSVALLAASTVLATDATEGEDTVNLNYRGPPRASYQVPFDKDIAYADKSVPYLFDYLPPLSLKAAHYDPRVEKLEETLGRWTDLQGRLDTCYKVPNLKCDPYFWWRQPDGTCNNLNITWLGASGTPFKRMLRPQYQDGIQAPRVLSVTGRKLKGARDIALKVHSPYEVKKDVSTYMTAFGQFVIHDVADSAATLGENGQPIGCTCETAQPECFNIDIPANDYHFKKQKCMVQARLRDSRVNFNCDLGYRNQLNMATSFVDLDVVYGASREVESDLRAFYGGRMHVSYFKDSNGPFLPQKCKASEFVEVAKTKVCPLAGDHRAAENPLLTSMHTVFLRLHNLYAARLAKVNPYWDDERLFQEAKRITSSVYQHIVYAEWLPLVVGYELHKAFHLEPAPYGYFDEYDERMNPGTSSEFAVAAARFGHAMLPSSFTKADANYYPVGNVSLRDALFRPDMILKGDHIDQFMRGCLYDRILQAAPHVGEDVFNWFTIDQGNNNPTKFFSLPAFNIQRGREVGLPPYVYYREMAGLNFPYSFDELSWISPKVIKRLKAVYESVLDVDLFTGGLSEHHTRGGLVGPTFGFIIARGFRDWKYGDRWFYENSPATTPYAFTPAQLINIKKMTLASVLCSTLNIKEIPQNVFLKADKAYNPVILCKDVPQIHFNLYAALPDDANWPNQWTDTAAKSTEPLNAYAYTNPVNWIYPGQEPPYGEDGYKVPGAYGGYVAPKPVYTPPANVSDGVGNFTISKAAAPASLAPASRAAAPAPAPATVSASAPAPAPVVAAAPASAPAPVVAAAPASAPAPVVAAAPAPVVAAAPASVTTPAK